MTRFAVVFDHMSGAVERLVRVLGDRADLVFVADARTRQVEAFASQLGAELLVAEHRMVDLGKGLTFSDVALASRLASQPLDAILYATDALVDFAWHEPALASVPKGRVATGLLGRLGAVVEDTAAFAALGHRALSLAGDAATADFVVTGSTVLHQELLPTDFVIPTRATRGAGGSLHVLDVTALSAGETPITVADWAARREGTLVVVGTDLSQGTALQTVFPADLTGRVLFASSDDPWCRELVASADTVEVAGVSDSGEELSGLFESVPPTRPMPERLATDTSDLRELADLLTTLQAEDSEAAVIVAGDEMTDSVFSGTRALHADLGFVAAPTDPMGDLDPGRIRDDVVLIGPRARPAVVEAIRRSDHLRTLIYRLCEPSLISSAVVGLVPGDPVPEPLALRTTRVPDDLGLRLWPPLAPMPNASAEPVFEAAPFDPVNWIGSKNWGTRWRLALPWRWGLLSKAMRGRW